MWEEAKYTLRTTKSYLSYKLTTSNFSVKIDAQVVASDTQILKTKQCAEQISPTNFQMDNHEFLLSYHTLVTSLAKTTSFHLEDYFNRRKQGRVHISLFLPFYN